MSVTGHTTRLATAFEALKIVDAVLLQAGYSEDSSARHNLAIARSSIIDTCEALTTDCSADVATAIAHRACCGAEHDPQNGKLHGYCIVCGVPWPCETAQYFLRAPLSAEVER